jgi:hypothetical protein
MSWGGKRPGAGRPKGAISKSTRALLEASKAGGEMPVEYMLRVMRDPNVWSQRRDKMALAAATYLHAQIRAQSEDGPEDGAEAEATDEAEAETTDKVEAEATGKAEAEAASRAKTASESAGT